MKEDKIKIYEVYCATNKLNGKSYIGQTSEGLHERMRKHHWNSNLDYRRHISAFNSAIHKYGKEVFDWVVLETHTTLEDCNEAEEFFIDYLNTLTPNGYNIMRGGNNHHLRKETKLKISEKLKKTSSLIGLSGKDHPAYGHKPWNDGLYIPNHGVNRKITGEQARMIYKEYIDGYTILEIKNRYLLQHSAIRNIIGKRCWIEHTKDLPDVDTSRDAVGENFTNSKLNNNQVLEIYNKYYLLSGSNRQKYIILSKEYNVSTGTIRNIVSGRNWNKITGHKK